MKAHNGMRPLDIVVLLKIIALNKTVWQYRDLSAMLTISTSEISESLNRSRKAGLIDDTKKKVHRNSIMEFIEHGLKYVFPQQPGSVITGYPTGHSHPFFKHYFTSEIDYVWPDDNGSIRGMIIEPLHKGVVKASKEDDAFYLLLACIDVLRVGKVREIKLAKEELRKRIL